MRVAVIVAFMLVSGAGLACEAGAQEISVDRVRACAAVKEDAARLRCFDSAVPALRFSEAPAISKAPGTIAAPANPPASSILPAQTPDRISVGVTAIDTGGDGKLRFSLSNGETWRQTDSTLLRNMGKGPWEGELRKAALGSYMLKIGNKTPVRVTLVK